MVDDGLSAFNATAAKNRSQTSKEEDSSKVSWAQTKKKETEYKETDKTNRKKGRKRKYETLWLLLVRHKEKLDRKIEK